ncbi:MAG: hypothetical protein IIB64_01525 [Proteobacteria bacterium]|nr:hypothetical protein [Pseudomonadota bacterium]
MATFFKDTLPAVRANEITLDKEGRVIIKNEKFRRMMERRMKAFPETVGFLDNCDCERNRSCEAL